MLDFSKLVGALIIIGLLSWLMMTFPPAGVVIVVVIGILIWYRNRKDSSASTSEAPSPSSSTQTDQSSASAEHHERRHRASGFFGVLLRISESIYLDPNRDEEVCTKVDKIVDSLLILINDVDKEDFPSRETRYVVTRLPGYLEKLLSPYVSLDARAKVEKKGELLLTLESVDDRLNNIKENLRSGQIEQMTIEADFIKSRMSL